MIMNIMQQMMEDMAHNNVQLQAQLASTNLTELENTGREQHDEMPVTHDSQS
jgi:hypothetical protein